jgi:hypothetical protein
MALARLRSLGRDDGLTLAVVSTGRRRIGEIVHPGG